MSCFRLDEPVDSSNSSARRSRAIPESSGGYEPLSGSHAWNWALQCLQTTCSPRHPTRIRRLRPHVGHSCKKYVDFDMAFLLVLKQECPRGGLVTRTIYCNATDHGPQFKADKEKGNADIHEAPFGIPGIETTSRLMLNAVSSGLLSLQRLVHMMCEQSAKLYGLYPKKGTLQPGSDADLVIVDPDRKERLSNEDIVSKCGWTTFDGMETTGAPVLTMVRGHVVMKDGHITGEAGVGVEVTRN